MSQPDTVFLDSRFLIRGDTIVNSFALLFVLIASSYGRNLLSCDIQDSLLNSVFAKHFITFCLLLFFVILKDKDRFITYKKDELLIPKILAITTVMYLLFLLAGRMKAVFAITIIGLSIVYALLEVEKENKSGADISKDQPVDYKKIENQKQAFSFVQQVIWYIICIMIVFGVGSYYIKQRRDHPNNFSHIKFLFGTSQCERFKGK